MTPSLLSSGRAMAEETAGPARPVPALAQTATVLHVEAGQWCYGPGCAEGEPVDLLLTRVRFELACHYGDRRVWVEGHALSCRATTPRASSCWST